MIKKFYLLCFVLCFPFFLLAGNCSKSAEEQLDFSIASHTQPAVAVAFQRVFLNPQSEPMVELSDGSLWHVRNKEAQEVVNDVSQMWHSGDEIRIDTRQPREFQGNFILKNVRNHTVFLADLSSKCSNPSNAYYIERLDDNGYALLTKDGMEWSIGWLGSFTSNRWRKGDRILINKSYFHSGEDYIIINTERKNHVWASLIQWK